MPDLRSFHAEVGRCWIDAQRGTQSQAETTLLDLGFLILQQLTDVGSVRHGVVNPAADKLLSDIGNYVNLAHSIFDPMPTPIPPRSNRHE